MGLAMLAGGVAGILIRLIIHRDQLRAPTRPDSHRTFARSVAGALVLGLLTGATMSHQDSAVSITLPSVAGSAVLLTYCVFNGGIIARITRRPRVRAQLAAGLTEALVCFATGTTGVIIGIWLVHGLP